MEFYGNIFRNTVSFFKLHFKFEFNWTCYNKAFVHIFINRTNYILGNYIKLIFFIKLVNFSYIYCIQKFNNDKK
jgi:hypothetical protein